MDLTFDFDEQKQFFVRRIDFSGNTTTRDKVIRRELLVSEGDIFNNRAWELSFLRLNQLDYFDKVETDGRGDQAQYQAGHRGYPAQGQGEGQAVHQLDRRRQRAGRQLHRPELSDQQLPRPRRDAHAIRPDSATFRRAPCSVSPSRICSTGRSRPALRSPTPATISIRRSRPPCCWVRRCSSIPTSTRTTARTRRRHHFRQLSDAEIFLRRLGLTYGYSRHQHQGV